MCTERMEIQHGDNGQGHATYSMSPPPSLLTGGLVVDIVVALGAVDAQEDLVVVVFVPVEGQHPGAPALWVATEQV